MQKYVNYKLREIDQTWAVLYILELKNQWFCVEFELFPPTSLREKAKYVPGTDNVRFTLRCGSTWQIDTT